MANTAVRFPAVNSNDAPFAEGVGKPQRSRRTGAASLLGRAKRLCAVVVAIAVGGLMDGRASADPLPQRPTTGYGNAATDHLIWLRNALAERYHAAGFADPSIGSGDIHLLKLACRDIVPYYADINQASNGTFEAYFSTPNASTNYPVDVPMLSATGLLARLHMPTNYFEFTPMVFLSQVPSMFQWPSGFVVSNFDEYVDGHYVYQGWEWSVQYWLADSIPLMLLDGVWMIGEYWWPYYWSIGGIEGPWWEPLTGEPSVIPDDDISAGGNNYSAGRTNWVVADYEPHYLTNIIANLVWTTKPVSLCATNVGKGNWMGTGGFGWAWTNNPNAWSNYTTGGDSWPFAILNSATEPSNLTGIVGSSYGWAGNGGFTETGSVVYARSGWAYIVTMTWTGTTYAGTSGDRWYGRICDPSSGTPQYYAGNGYDAFPFTYNSVFEARIPETAGGNYFRTASEWWDGHQPEWNPDGTGYVHVAAVSYDCPFVDVCRNSQVLEAAGIWTGAQSERQMYAMGRMYGGMYPGYSYGPFGFRMWGESYDTCSPFTWSVGTGMSINSTNVVLEYSETSTSSVAQCWDFSGTNTPFAGTYAVQKGWAVSNAFWVLKWDGTSGFQYR